MKATSKNEDIIKHKKNYIKMNMTTKNEDNQEMKTTLMIKMTWNENDFKTKEAHMALDKFSFVVVFSLTEHTKPPLLLKQTYLNMIYYT